MKVRLFILLALFLAWCGRDGLRGQNVLSLNGPTVLQAGSTAVYSVDLSGPGTPAAVEFTFKASSYDAQNLVTTIGTADQAPMKSLSCAPPGTTITPTQHCVIWGMNQTTISPGTVALVTVTIAPSPSPQISFSIVQPVEADPAGIAIPISSGPPLTASLLGPPGTIVVLSAVIATAGTGSGGLQCILTTPSPPTVHTICIVSDTVTLRQDVTPVVGAPGHPSSYQVGQNSMRWTLTQPTPGVLSWQVTANGVTQSGTFP